MCPNATAVDLHPDGGGHRHEADTDVSAAFVGNIRTNRGAPMWPQPPASYSSTFRIPSKKLKTRRSYAQQTSQPVLDFVNARIVNPVFGGQQRRLTSRHHRWAQTPMDHEAIEEGLLEFDGPASRVGNPQDQRSLSKWGSAQIKAAHPKAE